MAPLCARLSLLLQLVLLGMAATAGAAEDPKLEAARIHMRAAISYYDDGRYEDGAREMEAAYHLKPLPDLQYNLAQCYERLNRLDQAADAYQHYLDGKPDAADRVNVVRRIENLKQRAKEAVTGRTLMATPPEKVVFKTIVVYRDAPPPPGRAARWAAYGVGVLGLAVLGAGVATAILASGAAHDVSSLGNVQMPPSYDGKARDAAERGQNYQAISVVSFVVAGVALLGAVGLYGLGNRIDREAPKLTLAPALGPSGGGLWASGRF